MKSGSMRRFFVIQILAFFLLVSPLAQSANQPGQYFAASPFVQLGYRFNGKNLTVSWLAEDPKIENVDFEYKKYSATDWKKAVLTKNSVNGHPELTLVSAEMSDLPADTIISYKISKDNRELFQASTQSLPAVGGAVNFAVIGDVGEGSEAEAKIAEQMKLKEPSMQIIVGDIVYPIGSVRNYLRNFFPFVNQAGGRAKGASVLQSTISVAVPGNHDLTNGGGIDARDLDLASDSLAYFTLWKQPLNGPTLPGPANTCQARGSKERINDFLKAAGDAFPRMTNFSFDYGNCHVLVLDGNEYMDWTDENLRKWVDSDLSSAVNSRWKIVAFHQPGFNSDWAHREEQRMRHLSDIFEKNNVDVVYAGHSHSYQRSYPLIFKEVAAPANDREAKAGYVYGTFKMDKSFDGDKNRKPHGVIYIVTGAGGAHLSGGNMENEPGQWLPFTSKFSSKHHSFTFCHLENDKFVEQQFAEDGSLLDQFTIEK
jgi:predicted phosphodiesterase